MSLADDLKAELKERIRVDMTPFGKWNEKLWAKITFGDYYGKSDVQIETIRRVVGETVDNVLSRIPPAPGFQMTVDSWAALQGAIDASDTAETALPDMEDCALDAEPRAHHASTHVAAAAKKGGAKKGGAKKGGSKKGNK